MWRLRERDIGDLRSKQWPNHEGPYMLHLGLWPLSQRSNWSIVEDS